jgi:hypothetical protein
MASTRDLGLCGILLVLAGCYAYAPVDGSALAPRAGESVRVVLEQPGPVALRDFTVTYAVRLDGEFVRADTTDVTLSTWWVVAAGGAEHRGVGETVTVPWSNVVRLERRALSMPRTGLVTAGIVAGAFVLGNAMYGGGGAGENGGPPPVSK